MPYTIFEVVQVGFSIKYKQQGSLTHSCVGVAADISHINTKSTVKGYNPGESGLKEALTGAEIVLIPAGVPRKPGMTRDGKTAQAEFLEIAFH